MRGRAAPLYAIGNLAAIFRRCNSSPQSTLTFPLGETFFSLCNATRGGKNLLEK
jgi:hypothetical protein